MVTENDEDVVVDPEKDQTTEENEPTLEELQEENRRLKLKLMANDPYEMEFDLGEDATEEPEKDKGTPKGGTKPKNTPKDVAFDLDDFDVSDEEFDAALTSKEALVKILKTVAKKSATLAHASSMKSVDEIVSSRIGEMIETQGVIDEFYSKNQDLEPYSVEVNRIAQAIKLSKPQVGTKKIMDEAGVRVRKLMRLSKTPAGAAPPAGRRPNPKAPKLSGVQEEMSNIYGW